jgi:M6 family metalloprotease-like protein
VSTLTAQSPTPARRVVAVALSLLIAGALMPWLPRPVHAEPDPSGAAAAGFLFYKYPTPQPVCEGLGLNISGGPFFGAGGCGFAEFGISGAGASAEVIVEFRGPDGEAFAASDAVYDATDATWSFRITPADDWPAGWITAVILVDGEPAGETRFGHKVLGAALTVDQAGAPYAPGDDVPLRVSIGQMDNDTDLSGGSRTGVAASFAVSLVAPDGTRAPVPGGPFTAGADGSANIVIPGALSEGLEGSAADDFAVTPGVVVHDATYEDATSGVWAADEAGRTGLTLLDAPNQLQLRASYVSSVGWVKPGESFPFRVFVTNAMQQDATGASVTIDAPPSLTFLDATPLSGGGTATTTAGSITWALGTVPAATEAGPMVRTLVVTARAASLATDPEVVWKDLSSQATLSYGGGPAGITASTHGPKVIPPDGGFETARYGDKPFPIVPVEYVDLERQGNAQWDNDADKLDTVVNSPDFTGSTFNLYQEMSYGQLFPQGSVPTAGIGTADFSSYGPGFDFTTPDRTDPTIAACRGATMAEAPGTIGSAAFDTRIQDGWYQLPGTTEYYGGDFPVFTSTTLAIDSACGPLGKAVYDAAQIADPEIDYNAFDSDKDGVVDFFMMVFVGCGGNGASQVPVLCPYLGNQVPWYDNIWPHSSSLEGQFSDPASGLRGYVSDDQLTSLTDVPQCWTSAARQQFDDCAADGGSGRDELPVHVRVGPYNVNPETVFQSASVISHEYGHHLGLPDFYNSGAEVYGDLNLMAADYSQHMTVFGKQELGWVVPRYLAPGETLEVAGWNEIKRDTGEIAWQRPDGTPYTLSAANGDQNIHNGEAYGLKLGGRQIIDPATVPSGSHVWWSGRGNDFGCSPTGGHNLDLALPELASVPAGSTVTLELMSSWDIEWDWDYGFVLTSTDGASFASQPSANGYTTESSFNPNRSDCLTQLDNGITGTSGAWQAGEPTVTAARLPEVTDYSHGAPFLADSYDISELAGQDGATVRFSYYTDGAFDRPGWFIDDVVVKVDGTPIYESDFEADAEAGRLSPDGWSRIASDEASAADHAYYLELRDQSGFDFDGHGQSDRGDTSWAPGVFIEYTDEAHGYGNNGTPEPPAQHYLDSQPIPGSDCVNEQNGNCADASFTGVAGDDRFSDAVTAEQPGGFVNSFSDPDSAYGDGFWHFDYGCLDLEVTAMDGAAPGPVTPVAGDLAADAVIRAGDGCAPFGYGRGVNATPLADAQARPLEAEVGEPVVFDGSGSTDDREAPNELAYAWDFGDGEVAEGQSVVHAYAEPGEYTATLTVTDADGASDTATVTVTVTPGPANLVVRELSTEANTGNGAGGGKPKQGDKVVVRAVIDNVGTGEAPASVAGFTLDDEVLPGSPVEVPALAAGGSATVELTWDTRGVKGDHVIGALADAGEAVEESDEGDNGATLEVSVRGNTVRNGDFEQSSADGSGPAGWEASDGAGDASWDEGSGTEGSRAVSLRGDGRSVALAGMPAWTSDPIDVTPGEALELQVRVGAEGMSSAPGIGLAYLGSAGELLQTVRLLNVPLDTDGLTTLSTSVSLPPGVVRVRVVLFGFSPADLRTAGTVTFDDVGLFGP